MWLELLICAIHLPPSVTFEVPAWQLHNFTLHRAETLFCTFNSLRLFLLWRVFKDWVLQDLPSQHAIEMFANVRIDSKFALKRVLNSWQAVWFLTTFWAMLLVIMGYWYRSAEVSACLFPNASHPTCQEDNAKRWTLDGSSYFDKTNDLYLQNSIWFAPSLFLKEGAQSMLINPVIDHSAPG